MKEVLQTSAKKHIPKKRKKKQPWITKRTLNLADERRSAKAEGNTDGWSRLLLLLLLPKHLYSAPRRTERFTEEKERKIENKNYGNK